MTESERDKDLRKARSWLIEATSDPENHKLGDWVLPNMTREEWRSKDLKGGGFGLTLPVEKPFILGKSEVPLLGQVKFYFNSNRNRFDAQAESATLLKLNSRLIPKLYALGATSGSHEMPYVIMERIEGPDVGSKEFKPLTASEFKTMAIDTLRALRYAKEKDISHTDIKPANIMYSQFDDTYVIIDFGIAKILKRNEVEGQVGGTEGYRAPEAFSEIIAHKSDIFSLGLTFYYALTRKNPVSDAIDEHKRRKGFERNDDRILRDAEYQELLENLEIDFKGIPDDQAELLRRMLEVDYRKRLEVRELLGLASQLQVGTTVFDSEANDPWAHLLKTVGNQLAQNGLANFRVAVREAKHGGLWLKVVAEKESVRLVCSRPKNPIGLSQLGWKNSRTGLMDLNLERSVDSVKVANYIKVALEKGYSIEYPWTITFG